jgi:hypothetical protein
MKHDNHDMQCEMIQRVEEEGKKEKELSNQ